MSEETASAKGRGRRVRVKRIALVLAVLALMAWAGVLGWYLHEWSGRGDLTVEVDRPVQIYSPEAVTEGSVPNVVGLTEDEAMRVLSDAGIAIGTVRAGVVPDVGPPGLVVRQVPPSGVAVGKRDVSLAISGPALMPDLEGETEADAKETLSSLGARVSVVDEYQAGAAEGSVIATEPGAGETIVDKAVLHVAEPLSSVYLTQLSPLEANCRTAEEATLAGEQQTEAIICLPEPGAKPRSIIYQLGGEAESFRAEVGLDDASNAEVPVELRVVVDGDVALHQRLEFGEREAIEVPVLGKFQLRLEATAIGVAPPGATPVRATFGEPRLVGSRSAIDQLAEGAGE